MAFELLVKGTIICSGDKEKAQAYFNALIIDTAAKQAIKAGL